jgi:CRISPR-associated protein Csx17
LRDVLRNWSTPINEHLISRTWGILKLLHSPLGVQGISLRMEPRITALLRAGRVKEACMVASTRLRVSGLNPRTSDFNESIKPLRLLASLMFPVKGTTGLEKMILLPSSQR